MCHKTQTQRPHDKVEEALCVRVNGTELFLLYNIDNSLDFIPLGSERSKSDSKLHLEMFQTRKWQSFCLCTFWKKNVYSDTSCMVLQKKKIHKIISQRYSYFLFWKTLFQSELPILPCNPNPIWSCSEVKCGILTSICCHGNNGDAHVSTLCVYHRSRWADKGENISANISLIITKMWGITLNLH